MKGALSGPLRRNRIEVGPVPHRQAGEVGGAEGGRFGDLRANDLAPEDVALVLHEQIVDGGAAVDPKLGDGDAGVGLHGAHDVDGLVGNAVEHGPRQVGLGAATCQAEDGTAGMAVPMGRAEAGEGRDNDDPIRMVHGASELLDVA